MSQPPTPPPPQHQRLARQTGAAEPRPERRFAGIPISPGVAIGPVFTASEPAVEVTRHKIQAADTAAEGARFDAAIAQSRKQLVKLRARLAILPEESQQEIAPLIDAYLRMIGPSRLVRGVRRRIDETAASAPNPPWSRKPTRSPRRSWPRRRPACPPRTAPGLHPPRRRGARDRPAPGAQPDPRAVPQFRRPARQARCWSASRCARPMRRCSIPRGSPAWPPRKAAPRGTPRVMLRALGVPAVLGAAGLAQAIRPGDLVVVDGAAGTVVLNPTPATLAAARRAVTAFARERQRYARLRRLPAETQDGADGRAAGQPGAADRAAADRPVRRRTASACCAPSSCS